MAFENVAFVLVNYGSIELLSRRFEQSAYPGALTVVVDNFTTESERAAVVQRSAQFGWLAVTPETNTGFGGGCNLGVEAARAAGCRQVVLLNPDADIDPASVELLLAAVRADPMTLAGPRVVKPDGTLWSAGMDVDLRSGDMRPWRLRWQNPQAKTLPWLTGACLAFDLALWDVVGGFDESYFLYWEDVDFCVRAVGAGAKLALVEQATATHAVGGTQGAGKSEIYYYYNIVNRSRFARGHLAADVRRRWRQTAPRAAWRIVRRGGRRQFLQSVRPWRALWRGLRDSDYKVG